MPRGRSQSVQTVAGAELGIALRRLRRERGLTQRDLLGPLNLASHSVIADYESGKRIPAPDILAAYQRFFGPSAATLRQRALAERAAAEADDAANSNWASGLFGVEPVTRPGLPPMQLPPDLADFTGRHAELPATGSRRPVTVIAGPPGIGKTVFAVHLAPAQRPVPRRPALRRPERVPPAVGGSWRIPWQVPARTRHPAKPGAHRP